MTKRHAASKGMTAVGIVMLFLFGACGGDEAGSGADEEAPANEATEELPSAEPVETEAAAPEADVTSCEVVSEKDVEKVFAFDVVRVDAGNSSNVCTWRKAEEGDAAIYWELAIGVNPANMSDLGAIREALGVDEELQDLDADEAFRSGGMVNILKDGQHAQIRWIPAEENYDASLVNRVAALLGKRM